MTADAETSTTLTGDTTMIDDEKLAVDESRRLAQLEAVKGQARGEVTAEVASRMDAPTRDDDARAAAIAGTLKNKAYDEVVETETELERTRGLARISQVVDYVFYLVYGIVGLEIILELLGARESAGFKRLIDTLSAPLLAPFEGLMPDPGRGAFRLMLSYIMALVVYLLLHLAINGLLRMFAHRKVAV
jgi:uncharacterized protein YggT (Ycf19 family)